MLKFWKFRLLDLRTLYSHKTFGTT